MVILSAVDNGDFGESIVATAYDLAEAYDDELIVLHVMTRDQFESRFDNQIDYYVDDGAAHAAETAKDIVTETLSEADRVSPQGRVGAPAEEIINTTQSLNPRYLVLGGRKRSPVGKAVFGSITQSVLLSVTTPTVTVMHK